MTHLTAYNPAELIVHLAQYTTQELAAIRDESVRMVHIDRNEDACNWHAQNGLHCQYEIERRHWIMRAMIQG